MTDSNHPATTPAREARARVARAAMQSIWAACIVFLVTLALLVAIPQARAVPIVDDLFDFSLGDGGWTGTPVGKSGLTPPATGGKRWTYANPLWSVNWSPVDGPLVATGNYLTSGTINPAQQVGGDGLIDAFRISISHKFDFGSSINGIPPAAGQIAYKINGDPWTPIPASAFQQGTLTNFTPTSVVWFTVAVPRRDREPDDARGADLRSPGGRLRRSVSAHQRRGCVHRQDAGLHADGRQPRAERGRDHTAGTHADHELPAPPDQREPRIAVRRDSRLGRAARAGRFRRPRARQPPPCCCRNLGDGWISVDAANTSSGAN